MAYCAAVTVESFLRSFLNNAGALLSPNSLKMFQLAGKELSSFMTFVEGLDSRSRQRMKPCLQRTAEAIRYLGDEVFRGDTSTDEEQFRNSKTCRDLNSLIETANKAKEEYYEDESGGGRAVVSESNMVGFREERRSLKEKLLSLWVANPVVVLAGMAGIGKTTLALEMFRDLDVLESFDCCVWVTVGDEWRSEEVTKAILDQVDSDAHQLLVGSEYEEEVGRLRLKQSMMGKKYLVVLNDVSYDNVLDYLRTSLPGNRNGSRVLLTYTRKKSIDKYHNLSYTCLIEMRLMNEEESWHLLCDKVFGGKRFLPQLEKHGKMIAKKCDGLPLTIVTVADLLSKADDTGESFWADVATQRKHQVFVEAYDRIKTRIQVMLSLYGSFSSKLWDPLVEAY